MTKRVLELNWFKENGFFSEEGEHAVLHFKDGLSDVLFKDEIKELTVSQLQTLKSNLLKKVSDAISEEIAKKKVRTDKFAAMTDEEFFSYLGDRYGEEFWPIVNGGLSREEEDRLPRSKIRELEKKK